MADGGKRILLLKRFLHDRLHPGRTVGNSHYEWGYNYEENVADPHDFLCYGCDEGRNGFVINIRRKLGDIELHEQACRGCMRFLDSIRLFSIPFDNSTPIKDVLDGQYHYQISLSIKDCSPLTRRILILIKEVVISNSSLVMGVTTTSYWSRHYYEQGCWRLIITSQRIE